MTNRRRIRYVAAPTLSRFHRDDAFVRGIMGPIGSGKSVACTIEAMRRAKGQQKGPDGRRHTRGAVIRNSYRELQDTTIKTFFDWLPADTGHWVKSDMMWVYEDAETRMEVLFRALDRPDDVKKLLSLELTWAWINEAREVPRAVVDMLTGRVGRYPSARDGGPSWFGIWMDTNPPDDDHWWYRLAEEARPKGWAFFRQPSGRGEQAENVDNLPPGYYDNIQAGKDPEWIKVYVDGEYGYVQDGKPIYPEYQDSLHCPGLIPVDSNYPTLVGLDFGLTPAAAIVQQAPDGQYRAVQELVTDNMGAERFAQQLGRVLRRSYATNAVEIIGDPAGDQRSQVRESETVFSVLRANGIEAIPASSNDFPLRRDAVASNLGRLTMTGRPALVVSSACPMLRKGFAGRYRYRRLQVAGDERYEEKPDKNAYSHVHDALQYALLGAGEGDRVVGVDAWREDEPDFDFDYGVI